MRGILFCALNLDDAARLCCFRLLAGGFSLQVFYRMLELGNFYFELTYPLIDANIAGVPGDVERDPDLITLLPLHP
jgi:hypothetical protein